MSIHFQHIEDPDEFSKLRGELSEFQGRFPDGFFYSPEWIYVFHKVLAGDGRVLHIIGRDENNRLRGSVHLAVIDTKFLKLFDCKALAFLGTRSVVSPEHLELPLDIKCQDEWFVWLEKIFREKLAQYDFAVFDSVAENARNLDDFINYLRENGYRVETEQHDVCLYFDLPERFDDIIDRYSANRRKIIRRILKRNAGKFEMVDYRGLGGIEKALEIARQLHRKAREKKGDLGSFDRAGYIEFHRALAREIEGKGSLYLKFLMKEKTAIAFRYGFLHRGIYYDYQTGYDPQYSESSPGVYLMALIIRDLIEKNCRRFDFLRGDESYKRHWSDKVRKTYRYYVFGHSSKARFFHLLLRIYHMIKLKR